MTRLPTNCLSHGSHNVVNHGFGPKGLLAQVKQEEPMEQGWKPGTGSLQMASLSGIQ